MNSKKNLKTIGILFKGAPVGYINRTIIGRGDYVRIPFKGAPVGNINRTIIGRGDSSYLMGGQK